MTEDTELNWYEKIETVMIFCVLLAPYTLFFSGTLLTITGTSWIFLARLNVSVSLIPNMSPLGISLYFVTLPQVVFGYMMHRVYKAMSSVRAAFLVGILGIIPSLITSIANSIIRLTDPGFPHGWNAYPIPVILLVAYLYLQVYPPPDRTQVWVEE